jgi:RNA polymerase subunit RPABC4/transcription elongation factor Spt4
MAYCVHCGQNVTDEGTFCPQCGKSKAGASSGGGTAVVAVHKTETEKTFLSTQGATVTNTRIIVPGKTYAMAGITSVRSTEITPNRGWAILTAIVGILCLIGGAIGWGIFLLAAGVIWAVALKNTYAVAVNSASGEIQAVVSKDEGYITSIVQAVNEAIVYRN